jgi:hypothetical protein
MLTLGNDCAPCRSPGRGPPRAKEIPGNNKMIRMKYRRDRWDASKNWAACAPDGLKKIHYAGWIDNKDFGFSSDFVKGRVLSHSI